MTITVEMRTNVSQLYVALFGRAPDGEGLGYWVGQLDAGKPIVDIANAMYGTAPARAYYPAYLTNQEIVANFYTNVLGRPADPEGLAYWTGKLNEPGATPGSVIADIIGVVANYTGTDPAGLKSAALFQNKVQVAQWYGEQNGGIAGATDILSGVTEDPATVAAAEAGGVQSGQTFTLTTGQDTVVGTAGNDTIKGIFGGAAGDTVTAGDSVDGGAGVNTAELTAQGTSASSPAFNVKNVQHIVIKDSYGATFNALSVQNSPSIDFVGTTAGLTSTVTNADLASVVGVAGLGNLTVAYANTAGSADVAHVGLNGVGAALTPSTIDVGTSNTVESVSIVTTGTNYVSLAAGTAAGTINVTGDGINTIAIASDKTVSTIDASTSTGTNTFDLGATLSNGDVVKGGIGADTVKFAATGAIGTVTFTDVETVTGAFGATGASLDLGHSTGVNTVNITTASVATALLNANVQTINLGKAASTEDLLVDQITLKGATDVAINSVNGTTHDAHVDTVTANNSDGVNLTFNADAGQKLYVGDVYTNKSLGDIALNVGAGGSGELSWVSAGVGTHGNIGNIALTVGADGSGYIDAAAYSGNVGNVSELVHAGGSGYVYVSASAYSGTGGVAVGGHIGDVIVSASGAYADAGAGVSAGSGNVGNVTVTANGEGAIASAYVSAYQWSTGDATTGNVGNLTFTASGDGSYVSGYVQVSGSVGDVQFGVNGAGASGYLEVYAYSGQAGNVTLGTTGFHASGYAYVSAGDSVGNLSFDTNGSGASGYYEVSAGGSAGGNVGTVNFHVAGVNASGHASVDSMSGANGSGNIGDVTFTVDKNVLSGELDMQASGSVGNIAVSVGDGANAYLYASAYNGNVGAVTGSVGANAYFYGDFSAGNDVGNFSLSVGNGTDASAYFYGTNVGDVTMTSATTSTTATAHVYVDANTLSSVNLGGFAGGYYIDANQVTNGATLTGGQNGGTIYGSKGADVITGGAGADIIYGGQGNDTIMGGAGADKFVMSNTTATGTDWIKDFVAGVDKIITTGNDTSSTAVLAFTDLGALSTTTYTTLNAAVASFALGGVNVTVAQNAYEFTYGTDTYLIVDNAAAGYVAGTDTLVKITGVSGTLQTADIINA